MTSTLCASYVPPTLNKLILKADKILYGEITCIDETVIEVNVHGSINHNTKAITIFKFKEWDCGKRWSEYKVGDTSLFFLKLKNGGFYPLGGGNEGELPIHDDKVYVHASAFPSLDLLNQFEHSKIPMEDNGFNNPYNGYALDFEDFWQATAVLEKCFTSDMNATGNLINIRQLCPTSDYESTLENNKIFNWAFEKLID